MAIAIEKKLTEAGYRMLGDDESIERLILDILKTENTRYLKAIPFLIYKHKADIHKIHKTSKSDEINKLFQAIITITTKLFNEFNIRGILPNYIEEEAEKDFDKYNRKIGLAGLDYGEFKDEFELQLRNETKPSLFIEKQKIYAERDLQMYLSHLFTKKEKQIIRMLLEEKLISKTDYEYYSRKTKKKLNSIIGLQDFAKTLYAKTPKYDVDLYDLKKKLEEWIEKNSKDKKISIQKFFLQDNDQVWIIYKKKKDTSSEEQLCNTGIKLSRIKDTKLLNLLNKYKKHNFNMTRLKKSICGVCGKEEICHELLEEGKNCKYICQECLNKPASSDLREKFKDQIDFGFININ